jgi:hypothetical protein
MFRLAATITFIAVLYTIIWFTTATTVKNKIVSDIELLKKENVTFIYDDAIRISGFPFNFNLSFNNPKLEFKGNKYLQISSDNLSLTSNLITTNFSINPGQNINIETLDKDHTIQYNVSPEILIKLNKSILLKPITANIKKELWNRLNLISFADSGYKMIDTETKITLYSVDNSDFSLTHNLVANKESISLKANFNNQSSSELEATLGKTNSQLDIDLNLTNENEQPDARLKGASININKFNVTAEKSSLSINGQFGSTEGDLIPVGEATISITNYDNLLDYFASMKSLENKDNVKGLLQKIAAISDEEKNLTFVFKRSAGGNIKIGSMGIADIFAYYYKK